MRAIIFALTLALAILAVWKPSPARAYEMPYDPYRGAPFIRVTMAVAAPTADF